MNHDWCIHGYEKRTCKDCDCEHGIVKRTCKDCNTSDDSEEDERSDKKDGQKEVEDEKSDNEVHVCIKFRPRENAKWSVKVPEEDVTILRWWVKNYIAHRTKNASIHRQVSKIDWNTWYINLFLFLYISNWFDSDL